MRKNVVQIGLLLLVVGLAGCAHLQSLIEPPEVKVVSLTPQFITPQHVGFVAKLSITNRIPIRLPIKRLDFKVGINGKRFLTGSVDTIPTVGGSASQLVNVPFQVGFQEIAALVATLQKKVPLDIGIRGKVVIGGQFSLPAVPFQFAIQLPPPHLPVISFVGFKILKRQKKIGLTLKIENPNAFPLQLQDLNTHLKMGSTEYSLLALNEQAEISAEKTGLIQLQIGDSLEKTAGLFTQLMLGQRLDFTLGGELKSRSAYGDMSMPFESSGNTK
jgi:LEA14-like dessication related protein